MADLQITQLSTTNALTAGDAFVIQRSDSNFQIDATQIRAYATSGIAAGGVVVSAAGGVITSGTVSFANSNGVTFGANGQTVTASVKTDYAVIAAALDTNGNTAGAMATITSGTLVLAGGNQITLSQAGNSITISGPAQFFGGVSNLGNTAGSTTAVNRRMALVGSNNITLSQSSNGASITVSVIGRDAIGTNTALTAGPLAWTVGTDGISLNAGGAAGTTSGFAGNSISGSITHNTAGINISLNHPAWLTTAALSNHSHGNPQLNLTNLSGTTASNSAGLTLSLSAAATVAQTNQTLGLYASSNTTGQSSSSTFDARSVTFRGAGIASVGYSGGEVIISVPSGGGAGDGVNILAAGTQTANTTGTVVFSNSNGVTFGMSNNSVITASVNAGGGGATLSRWHNVQWGSIGTIAGSNGTIWLMPQDVPVNLSASYVKMGVSLNISSSSNSSHAGAITAHFGIYSKTGATLSLASSGSQSYQWTNTSNNSLSVLTGTRYLTAPITVNATPGNYVFAWMVRTTTTNANWFTHRDITVGMLPAQVFTAQLLQASSIVENIPILGGFYSVSSSVLPASLAISGVSQTAIRSLAFELLNFTTN